MRYLLLRWPQGRSGLHASARAAGVLLALLLGPLLQAQTPEPDARVLRQLLAERRFNEARDMIVRIDDPQIRAPLLYQIAQGQVQQGEYRSAVRSAGLIPDDRLRSAALDQVTQARGGAAAADFDSLIQLIQSTIEPDSWLDAGGVGDIQQFPTGVRVDTTGPLPLIQNPTAVAIPADWRPAGTAFSGRPLGASRQRCISLVELERQAQLRWALGQPPTSAMRAMAGLWRIDAVVLDPERQDILLVGPADDWTWTPDGEPVRLGSGRPVLRLDDTIAVLRTVLLGGGQFACSINPLPENLQRTTAYLERTSVRPLRPGERPRWLQGLRDALGQQRVDIEGVDPNWHIARVIFEADRHMKLIGMGLVDGPKGVPSYLDMIDFPPGGSPPPMSVLRWWFTLSEAPIQTDARQIVFRIPEFPVQVLSENEFLTRQGQRVHTGASDALNRQFAENFTHHFAELALSFPLYERLSQAFQLSLAAAVIRQQEAAPRFGWHLMHWRNDQQCPLPTDGPPEMIESIINHRVVHRQHVIAGVSGGVVVQPRVNRPAVDAQLTFPTQSHPEFDPLRLQRPWWWDLDEGDALASAAAPGGN